MASPISRQISLFGALRIQEAQENLPFSGEKAQNLLAYLLLHPVPQGREQLADLLFPDAPFDRVRRNFSDTLYRAQKTLGDDWLLTDGETVTLCKDKPLWVDVWDFDQLAASSDPADLQKAVTLYAGDLLPTCYEDWILPERELRRNQFLIALENLAAYQESTGQLQQALLTTRRLILAEPLHEPAHQSYLRLLGRLQRYAEALAHYEYLCQILQEELETTPLAETQAIFHAIEQERTLAATPPDKEQMPFVGRMAERAALLDAVEAALQGKGGIVAIEGEAGIGKSRLLREISAGARWRGATVIKGVASEVPQESPFQPLTDALSPLLTGSRLMQLETALPAEMLAALAPLYPAWGKYQTSASAEQARRLFNFALRPFGEAVAQLTPLVLILDDVQWASPALWQCLHPLTQGLLENGGLLILAYRRPGIEQTFGWNQLQTWDRDGILKVIPLHPLTQEDVGVLLDDGTQGETPLIHALTGGNPFRISEWLNQPEESPVAGMTGITRRLGQISEHARSVLECAAVLGEDIQYSHLSRMAEMPLLALANLSDELSLHHWLQPSTTGFSFVHDLIRTAIYTDIPPDKLQALHARAAAVYQALEPDNIRSYAFHLDRAGLPEAGGAYRQVGEQELERFAHREAQTAFERALALMPSELTVERLKIMLSLAWVFDVLGERTKQIDMLHRVLAGAESLEQPSIVLETFLALARALIQAYQFTEAEKYLQKALELARALQDEKSRTEVLLLSGMCETDQLHTKKSITFYRRALKLAQKLNSPLHEARALRGLGIAARDQGAPMESIKWLEQALAVQREIGDRLGEVSTHSNIVTAYYDLGAWDKLIETAEELIPRVERIGYRYNTGYLRQIQGLASYNLGDFANARRQLTLAANEFAAAGARITLVDGALGMLAEDEGKDQEALHFYHKALAGTDITEDDVEAPLIQMDLGALLLRLEQPQEAIPYLEAARAVWVKHEDTFSRLKADTLLGLVWLNLGMRERAETLAVQCFSAVKKALPPGEKPQNWLWNLFRLLSELGDKESAEAVIRAAYAELQRQAQAIQTSESRQRFFTRVPTNRAIVAAYDRVTHTQRKQTVSLARQTAPLGRVLRPDEYIAVEWTVNAPEDEAYPDKTSQRHYRLKRLLHEAADRGAAPTDDDLADALGVSRRTILRDMQTLSVELPDLPTRKRK